jgi:hypothetical protein
MVPEEHREECAQIDTEGLPTGLASEVAFSWNWVTGEAMELGRGLHRDYSKAGSTSICGTIDVLGVSEGACYVGDFKGPSFVKTKDNPQLLFAAMCAAKVHKKGEVLTEIIGIQGGSNRRYSVTVDEFDLDEFEAMLRGAIEMMLAIKAGELQPNFNEGTHCKYCPAFASCPAKTRLIRQLIDDPGIPTLTPENAQRGYEKWQQVKEIAARLSSAFHAYAKEHPIDLGNGRVFGSREKAGNEVLDGAITHAVLVEQFDRDIADLAVTYKASKKGITAAVKAAKGSGAEGTLKALNSGVLETVRFRGGASRKIGTVIDEHKLELKP